MLKNLLILCCSIFISACEDRSVIYNNASDLEEPYKIKIHEVKIESETADTLTVDFIYTYNHEVPAEQIKLYILPDHGYWQASEVKISKGKHGARVIIGLSDYNMKKDNVTESKTTKLRFRFDHYLPNKYMGNVWGQDVDYQKHWHKSI
ncbi:hypothetical protein AADZ86_07020 [Colwelliaceae bacterium BS250]